MTELEWVNRWRHKLACRCCQLLIVNPDLVRALFKLEDQVGHELVPTNMTRCHRHNRDVEGKPQSRHLTGEAIDITDSDLPADFYQLAHAAGFKGVLHYPSRGIWHLQTVPPIAEEVTARPKDRRLARPI